MPYEDPREDATRKAVPWNLSYTPRDVLAVVVVVIVADYAYAEFNGLCFLYCNLYHVCKLTMFTFMQASTAAFTVLSIKRRCQMATCSPTGRTRGNRKGCSRHLETFSSKYFQPFRHSSGISLY